jgi:hypothetical protein
LAASYSVTQKFFATTSNVWGRDFVTFALLADNDPSLHEFANEAGTAVDRLQDEWFEFATSTDQHRQPEEWTNWWTEAGVPTPQERASSSGSTYLFTWNPDRYDEAEIEKQAQEIISSGPTMMKWSSGVRRHLSRGERVFGVEEYPNRILT